MASSSKLKPTTTIGKKTKSQQPSTETLAIMAVERNNLISETNEDLVRVSPTTQALMQALVASAKTRSRDGLIKSCHRAMKRFLLLELINNMRDLIPDLQDIILRKIQVNDFKAWYYEVITASNKFYDIYDIWGRNVRHINNSGVATLAIDACVYDQNWKLLGYAKEHMKAWKYGMIHKFYNIPEAETCDYFTVFQKYVFKKVKEYRSKSRLAVDIQCANIEVTEEKVYPPHYLIILGIECSKYGDPICIRQRRVEDPIEARALGFFYIAQYINQALERQQNEENPPIIFHVGNTTVIAPGSMQQYYLNGIIHSESVHKYLEKVEAGEYLSQKRQEHLLETFLSWDEAYVHKHLESLFKEEDDSMHQNWESNVGDEGIHNLMVE